MINLDRVEFYTKMPAKADNKRTKAHIGFDENRGRQQNKMKPLISRPTYYSSPCDS